MNTDRGDSSMDGGMSESTNLVVFDEAAEKLSRQQIRRMTDVYKLAEEDLDDKKIIHPSMRDKRVLNVFREIRTKILQKTGKRNFTLLVTSTAPGGGNTFVSTNLAASFALDHGKTALLVDCNLGAPATDSLAEGSELGFSDFLIDPMLTLDQLIYATGIPRLRLIPAGISTDIGPEYYTSYRMQQFIEELKSRYSDRYIILDAPALKGSADARILADFCDYAAVVVPSGFSTRDQIDEAVSKLPAEKLVGLIFNN